MYISTPSLHALSKMVMMMISAVKYDKPIVIQSRHTTDDGEQYRQDLARLQARYDILQARYEKLAERHIDVQTEAELKYEALLKQHDALQRENRFLKQQATQNAQLIQPTPGVMLETRADDFQKIKGIGPALDYTLQALGYRTYEQIATWSDTDIDRVARSLGCFPERIRKDQWVEQAVSLVAFKRAQILRAA